MGTPVVIVASGGLPVTEATNGYGVPMTEATNGYGIPVTFVAAGSGGGALAVTGIVSGPSIQLSAATVAENAAISTVVGTLSVINGTGTYTFTLTNSAGGKFVLGGTNNSSLRTAALLDYETASSHTIAVSATNGVTPIAARNFTISVTDVAGPTITSATTASVLENAVLAHALTAGESSTWALVGGADQARFELSGSTLRWLANGTKDYEMPDDADANNTYVVQVRATSVATGETTTQTVTVTVLDDPVDTIVPNAPVLVWTSGTGDNTPNFTVDLPSGFGDYRDATVGDVIYLEIADNVAFTTTSTDTLDAGDVSGDIVAMAQATSLADGTYYAKARLKRGANYGPYSNVESKAISTSTFVLSYQSSAASSSFTSSINYGTLSYAAGATRTICVVQWFEGTSPGITGITIGGTALTQVSGAFVNTGDACADVWMSSAPLAGSSGAVIVTYTGNTDWHSSVALYSLTTATPAPGTPDTTINFVNGPTITAGPVTIPSGGGAIFAFWPYNNSTPTVTSGNGVIDATPTATGTPVFYYGHTTVTGSQTVVITYSVNDGGVITLVPWGP